MFMILANTLVLALKWYDMPQEVISMNEYLNYTFSAIFTCEAIIKLIAFRKNYFKDSWNKFDFIVVVGTWIVIIVLKLNLPIDLQIFGTILRTLRIGRIFRIIKRAPSIQIIF
jgi:voltage-dependent calcium channel L type alpha-1D